MGAVGKVDVALTGLTCALGDVIRRLDEHDVVESKCKQGKCVVSFAEIGQLELIVVPAWLDGEVGVV